jgi:hypothetical protein
MDCGMGLRDGIEGWDEIEGWLGLGVGHGWSLRFSFLLTFYLVFANGIVCFEHQLCFLFSSL